MPPRNPNRSRPRKGQPLAALALVLTGWVMLRVLLIAPSEAALPQLQNMMAMRHAETSDPQPVRQHVAERPAAMTAADLQPQTGFAPSGYAPTLPAPALNRPLAPAHMTLPMPQPQLAPAFTPVPASVASGHLMLYMAAFSQVSAAELSLPRRQGSGERGDPPPLSLVPRTARDRWSADSWLLLRRGGQARVALAGAMPTYGASQAGAVLRYQLAPGSGARPAAYVRGTAALNGTRQREAALGLSARPVARLPVVLAAELRATGTRHSSAIRPAAMAITEIAPIDLGRSVRAEVYAQAGYVGGRNRTAFGDGQVRIDASAGSRGAASFRLGAGLWGGAQKGASRLDMGPTVTVGVPLGEASQGRLALDWRVRVGGDARPRSGPALTLSAGF